MVVDAIRFADPPTAALLSLHEEGRLALSREYDDRRVLGSATAPE